MKIVKIIFALLLLFFLQNCDTVESDNGYIQITPGDDSLIPDSIKALMKEDAAHLALRDLYADLSKKENLVILPEDVVEAYYRGFVHIYNTRSIPARDSVIEMYKIRGLGYPETHSLMLSVDSTKNWVNAWKNNWRLTGNQQIDFLIETYNLELDGYWNWPNLQLAVLFSDAAINIYALSKLFEPIDGIIIAEPNGVIGDGDDIKGSIESNYLMYEFSYGWGDCYSGCIHRHYWLFQVRFGGVVEFIGSYGDTLP
ncbi:MAG: hypothetical protein KJO59_00605 [Ignavibacteria bacterium]|nr:hypothetical protein [Ignavibacteria bacterium]